MAFEISAKKETKRFNWLNIIFYFSLILLLAAVLSYFVLTYSIEEAKGETGVLDKKIEEQSQKAQELKNILKEKKKLIDDFSIVMNQHKLTHQLFKVVEEIIHPEIVFNSFNFQTENLNVKLSGTASSFRSLGEQILILKNENRITNFDVSNISLREGYVNFNLDIFLSPQVFIFSKE